MQYSLLSRDVEAQIFPIIPELHIGFVAYSPLGCGFLSGRIRSPAELDTDDYRPTSPRFPADALESRLRMFAAVQRMASEKGCTPAQISLT